MRVRGTVGVRLIAAFLLVNSLGYFAVGLYYLAVLLYPFSYIFSGIFLNPSLVLLWGSSSYGWHVMLRSFLSGTIGRNLVFQDGLLVSQISFYAALGALIAFVSWGLLRMKNWARRTTMVYAALYPGFIFVFFLTLWFMNNCVFNINLLVLLYHFIRFDNSIPFAHSLILILMVLASAFFLVILGYLSGDVKYEFE
ncbi:MAG: hypothetical protein QW261_16700 [Candidatus Jordarchaeaceae archaeon]